MIVKRAFKFKLKPTELQREGCLRFAGARRFIFNRGLARISHKFSGKSNIMSTNLAPRLSEAVLLEHCPRLLEEQPQSPLRQFSPKICEKSGLDQRQKAFEATGKSPSYFDQNKELTFLKESPETAWLKEIHSQVLQQGLKDLDRAFQNFFRRVKRGEKPRYPRFKKKGIGESFRFPQGVKVERSKVFLPKIGWMKFRKSREIQGTINETTLVQEGGD